MSLIVGIKTEKGVVIGADKQATSGRLKVEGVQKIWKSKYSNTAMGVVGYLRDADIISTVEDFIDFIFVLHAIKATTAYGVRTG